MHEHLHTGGVPNVAFWLAIAVGSVVQGFKGFRVYFQTGKWNLRRFVETGGMPSSHAASVAALSTEVAFHQGIRSILFGVTLYFSLVVMYDAMNLRAEAGKHADLLNELLLLSVIKDAYKEREKLKELLGHTPLEVIAGAIIGVAMAFFVNR